MLPDLPTLLQLCQCISDQHHLCCARDSRFILISRRGEFLEWGNGQQGMKLRSSLPFHLQLKLETNGLSSGTSTIALYQSASQEALFPLNFACGPLLLAGSLSLSCKAALLSF